MPVYTMCPILTDALSRRITYVLPTSYIAPRRELDVVLP